MTTRNRLQSRFCLSLAFFQALVPKRVGMTSQALASESLNRPCYDKTKKNPIWLHVSFFVQVIIKLVSNSVVSFYRSDNALLQRGICHDKHAQAICPYSCRCRQTVYHLARWSLVFVWFRDIFDSLLATQLCQCKNGTGIESSQLITVKVHLEH